MNRRPLYIPALIFLFLCACKGKKKDLPPEEEQPPVEIPVSSGPECKTFPPEPQPWGWTDSTADVNKNVNAFFFSPVSANEIVYVVNGDIFGYNKMYSYNITAKVTTFLASVGPYTPKVNSKGWIVFSTVDSDIFKIKTNGDSLTRLTNSKICIDPQWDHTDTNIYYFRKSQSGSPSMIIRTNNKGIVVDELEADFPNCASFRKKKQLIYLRQTPGLLHLVLRDTLNAERFLFDTPFANQTAHIPYSDMTIDSNDEFLYMTHARGILRYNIKTSATDTLLKNCPNYTYDNPLISFRTQNEITLSRHMISIVKGTHKLHEYHALEMNTLSKQLNEIKLFP